MSTAEDKKIALRRLDAFGGSVLTDLFIANKKNGVREGFRRLALLAATLSFVMSLNKGIDLVNLITQDISNIFTDIMASGTIIAISILCFIVVGTVVRAIGWVVEGFLQAK